MSGLYANKYLQLLGAMEKCKQSNMHDLIIGLILFRREVPILRTLDNQYFLHNLSKVSPTFRSYHGTAGIG